MCKYAGNRLKRSTLFIVAFKLYVGDTDMNIFWGPRQNAVCETDEEWEKNINKEKENEIYCNNQLNEYFTLYSTFAYLI